jgi:hypothetical protein
MVDRVGYPWACPVRMKELEYLYPGNLSHPSASGAVGYFNFSKKTQKQLPDTALEIVHRSSVSMLYILLNDVKSL